MRFRTSLHLMTQFGRVRKSLTVLLKFFAIYQTVCPPVIRTTAYLPLSFSFPFSHFKYKLSSVTFGVHISIDAWCPRTNSLEILLVDMFAWFSSKERFYFVNFERHGIEQEIKRWILKSQIVNVSVRKL